MFFSRSSFSGSQSPNLDSPNRGAVDLDDEDAGEEIDETLLDEPIAEPKKKQKQYKWTHELEDLLCKCFLSISTDNVVGSAQKERQFWTRTSNVFNEGRPRNSEAITGGKSKNKFLRISRETNRFVGPFMKVQNLQLSGKGESERVEHARTLYRVKWNTTFNYIHCWRVLCHEPK